MRTKAYALLLIPGVLLALLLLGLSLVQPAAQAQVAFDCSTATDVPPGDCEGLVALYTANGGENWRYKDNWLQSTTICSWAGVSCNNGRVGWLSLYDNRLTGTLPPGIGNLTKLTGLSLANNQITGLPAQIGNLTNLFSLYLNNNQIASLPPEIGNLTSLSYLNLGSNQITSLAPEIGNLPGLTRLWLDNNLLTTLPSTLGSLPKLWALSLSNNLLTSLPTQIGNLSATLIELYVGGNQLTALPPEVGNLTKLEYLHLHGNPLTGEVPAFLAGLPVLGVGGWFFSSPFTFYGTNWCEPAVGPVADWLAAITYEGTGLVCGQPTGGIIGQVTTAPGLAAADGLGTAAALPGIQVTLFRPLKGEEFHGEMMGQPWLVVDNTTTGAHGVYAFSGLGRGIDYRVYFADTSGYYAPQYYDNKYYREQSVPVSLTVGETRTEVDAALYPPQPTVVEVQTGGSVTPNPDGTVTIGQFRGDRSPITITMPITCPGGALPTDVNLVMTPPGTLFPMAPVGGDNYQATIPTNQVETAVLTVQYKCEGGNQETPVGRVALYDPSGIISDAATGLPVVGATVTLHQVPGWLPRTGPTDTRPKTCESNLSKVPGAAWSQPAPTELGVIVNPDVAAIAPQLARQQTDEVGYYGWDVSEGCWYVTVAAEGYAPLTSPVVGVPPEVTDLHLSLAPVQKIYLPLVLR